MHEFSLAKSLLELVGESARTEGIQHVRLVSVVIGEWAAVLPEALAGSFEMLAAGGDERFRNATLHVVRRAAAGECTRCGHRFEPHEPGLHCPQCGTAARLVSGLELYVDSYEGE